MACSATDTTSYRVEILDLESMGNIESRQRTTKGAIKRFSHDEYMNPLTSYLSIQHTKALATWFLSFSAKNWTGQRTSVVD